MGRLHGSPVMIRLLAIDTTDQFCSVALYDNGHVLGRCVLAERAHNRLLLPMIHGVMQEARISYDQIDALVFACGPGSFTGVRIALSAIQAISMCYDLPIVPISSLCAMAQGVYETHGHELIWVATDARKDQLYFARYQRCDEVMASVYDEQVIGVDDLVLPDQDLVYAVGNGWSLIEEQRSLNDHIVLDEVMASWQINAQHLIQPALVKFKSGELLSADEVMPTYLRGSQPWKKLSDG